MQEVIFDSSFLMAVAESPTTWSDDIAEAVGKFKPTLLDCVVKELRVLSSGPGRRARIAKVALQISEGFIVIPNGEAAVDDEVVSAAIGRKAIVATSDSDMAASLLKAKLKVVGLSSGRVRLFQA
ncbi:MAG: hypothetical protein HY296_06700 [Thaumarchaeota archaeon]|nr:hypothetical protein [Nitrososphaerota archaeon]